MGGLLCPLFGELDPNTMSPEPRPTSVSRGILVHPAVWLRQTRAENWGAVPHFLRGGELGPHLTQCGQDLARTVLRPTSIPSGILIHLSVRPQQTWADNGVCGYKNGRLWRSVRDGGGKTFSPGGTLQQFSAVLSHQVFHITSLQA